MGSAFLAHTHTMAQIIGLLDALASIYARLEHIEVLLPHVTPGVVTDRAKPRDIEIPDKSKSRPVVAGPVAGVVEATAPAAVAPATPPDPTDVDP